jgi:uncharacterized membrane protein YraQ (UPF0718 family)
MLRDKGFVLSLIVLTGLAGLFWAGSRYPALDQKAMMAGETDLAALGFDILLLVTPDTPTVSRILFTSVNWMYTNWKGMTFGVLFAAGVMCLISRLPGNCSNGLSGSLLGMAVGAPLGVCVNCATPIGRGMHESGMRPETSLAAMMSSPTLNFIVLTMIFSLLPLYMALLKVCLTLIFLLVVMPLLVRWLVPDGSAVLMDDSVDIVSDDECLTTSQPPHDISSWRNAVSWLLLHFATSLWFIIRRTAPLMILAGFLGAAAVTMLPLDSIIDLLPASGRIAVVASLFAVAAFGLFLPVPMAFDVLMTVTLLASGLHARYAMVLLFTLGIYSIYPCLVVARSHSWRLASGLAGALLILGMASGAVAHYCDKYQSNRNQELIVQINYEYTIAQLKKSPSQRTEWPLRGRSCESSSQAWQPQCMKPTATPLNGRIVHQAGGLTVSGVPHENVENPQSDRWFQRIPGPEMGLDEPVSWSAYKSMQPFSEYRFIAAGDVHNDGWQDVLVGSDPSYGGFSLYANQHGKSFVRQQIDIPELAQMFLCNGALVDMNNDGWLDICVSAWRHGIFVITSEQGQFRAENCRRLPLPEKTVLVSSLAFGDLERDGDLDLIAGRWTGGLVGSSGNLKKGKIEGPEWSRNLIVWQEDYGQFRCTPLPAQPGETLSTLLSDINQDGHADLICGNDFDEPDMFYLGQGGGKFKMLRRDDGIIPLSTQFTMSVTSRDLNNDLQPELYLAQIAYQDRARTRELSDKWVAEHTSEPERRQVTLNQLIKSAASRRDPGPLLTIDDPADRRLAGIDYLLKQWNRKARGSDTRHETTAELLASLGLTTESDLGFHSITVLTAPRQHMAQQQVSMAIPQLRQQNVLLVAGDDGAYENKAEQFGLAHADWAWNSKFADLDNDEFSDLLVVNGWSGNEERESNLLFRNQQGSRFVDQTESAGLTDHAATSAYCYVDYDNDGDIDIISVPINDGVRVFRNQSRDHHSLDVELRDDHGNRFGIGSQIIIRYGPNGSKHQMRELQASGGFLSFDPPIAHFGLAEYTQIESIEVIWSTGQRTLIEDTFPSGARYRVHRLQADTPPVRFAEQDRPQRQ